MNVKLLAWSKIWSICDFKKGYWLRTNIVKDEKCYCSSQLCGAAQIWLDEILPSVGMLHGGIPVAAFTSSVGPKEACHWFLVIIGQ